MSKIQIRNRFTNAVIFEGEYKTLRDAVIDAVANRANLSDADLSDANLSGADLSRADLSRADLSRATMPGFKDNEPQSLSEAAQKTKEWLLDGQKHWVQGKWIDTPDGAYSGTCMACLHGAAVYVGGRFGVELSKKLTAAGYDIAWNDASGRTVEEVAKALDEVGDVKALDKIWKSLSVEQKRKVLGFAEGDEKLAALALEEVKNEPMQGLDAIGEMEKEIV